MQTNSNEKIAEALRLLEEAARERKDEVRTMIADKYTHLKDAIIGAEHGVAAALEAARRQAVEAALRARDVTAEKFSKVAKPVNENVHENPWPYIGGAALTAMLLGYILGRNRK